VTERDFRDMSVAPIFANKYVGRDTRFCIPKKFLRELYCRGYEVVDVQTRTEEFFTAVSLQLMYFGYNYPVLKLRDAVIKYEKENAEFLKQSRLLNDPQSCFYEDPLTSCFCKLISVEDHVLSLEENRTPPDEFDVLCTALMLDMEVCIFSPSEDNKVLAKRYIEKAQYSRRIAVIYDVLQSPVRIFRPQ